MMDLQRAALATHGLATMQVEFDSVGTDSRSIEPGQLFVALRGERFDGHDFVHHAIQQGAAAAMVDQQWFEQSSLANPAPLLVVADTRLALGALAAHWRANFQIPVIGVTGSNGKTTVKEMCASILRAQASLDGFEPARAVLATAGNLNNDLGLPLTLLGLREDHRFAVVEMGMNRPGEIEYLSCIARPTVALVTNAHRAHLEGMGGVAEVAREKGAIYGGLQADGIAVVNADDDFGETWCEMNAQRSCTRFGLDNDADVCASYILKGQTTEVAVQTPAGRIDIELLVPGRHNVLNALAATAATLGAGASIEAVARGVESYAGTRGRLERKAGINGAVIIDDSYNANPDSVRAGVDVLAATPGRTILVLGDMGEVGEAGAQLHDEVGGYAKSQGVDALFGLGEMSGVATRNFGDGGRHFSRIEELVAALRKTLDGETVVLVKGSRFMRMERVVDELLVSKS